MYEQDILNYSPVNEQEEQDKQATLEYIAEFKHNVLTRDNQIAHLTSSGFILNEKMNKALMVYHNLYKSWSWTGGHVDGMTDLLAVALKEAQEETGVQEFVPLSHEIMAIDILPVWRHYKKGAFVNSHLHLNVAYVLIANEHQPLKVKEDENSAVGWIDIEELDTYCTEPELLLIYQKLMGAARSIKEKSLN